MTTAVKCRYCAADDCTTHDAEWERIFVTGAPVAPQRWPRQELELPPPVAGFRENEAGLFVPRPRPKKRYDAPIGVSLFTGAGGFDLGMVQAGFHVVAANEYDCGATETYLVNQARYGAFEWHFLEPEDEVRMNKHLQRDRSRKQAKDGDLQLVRALAGSGWISHFPDVRGCEHFWLGDVRKLTGAMILDAAGLDVGEVDCVFGGPPCQGFSRANNKRSAFDVRNSLVFEFIRIVLELRPKAMIMENVPDMVDFLTPDGIPVIDAISMILEEGGWSTFESIRKSLAASAGVALNSRKKPKRPKTSMRGKAKDGHTHAKELPASPSEQMAMFEAMAVVA